MNIKKQKTVINETASGPDVSPGMATLHPNSEPANDPKAWSKTEQLTKMLGKFAEMDKTTFTSWFEKVLASVGKEGDGVSDSSHNTNTNSIVPHPSFAVKEDIEALFGEEELSEEFKEKVTTLFEAAVNLKINQHIISLEEEFENKFQEKLSEEVENLEDEITTKLDAYLDSVMEQWYEDNTVALVSQIKSSIAEDFINGLKNLFLENFINIPDDKVDVVESLSTQVAELQEHLDRVILDNNSLKLEVSIHEKEKAFDEICEGLTFSQKEQFATLCESVEFDIPLDSFINKIKIIKENQLLLNKNSNNNKILEEEVEGTFEIEGDDLVENTILYPEMKLYMEAMDRTARKN